MSILKQYTLSAAIDIESFDPVAYTNSGLMYDGDNFIAKTFGDTFDHTLYSLSSNLYNQTWIDALSGSIDTRIDALEAVSDTPSTWGVLSAGTGIAALTDVGVSGSGETVEVLGYATISSQAKQAFDHSSNSDLHRVNARGWADVDDGGTIAHGLGALPATAYVMPSGDSVFAASITLDATNITVYHTSPDTETVSWRAEL